MNVKKKSFWLLSGLYAFTMCAAVNATLLTRNAEAATPTVEVSKNLEMTAGAATRLDEPYGLKFQATIENGQEATGNFGMLIVPYDYFAKANVTISETTDYVTAFTTAKENGDIPYAPIVVEELEIKQTKEGKPCVEHSVVGLQQSNYDRPFFGVAFEKVEGGYEYAAFNNNVRSIMQVASAAINEYNYGNLEAGEQEKYGKALDTLKGFVDTGISNAYGNSFTYAISGNQTVYEGYSATLSVNEGLFANWTSSDEGVATVDKYGVVTGVGVGTAEITAKNYADGQERTETHSVTVKESNSSVLTFGNLALANQAAFDSHWVENVTYAIEGDGKYYTTDKTGRWYKGDVLKITADAGYKIVGATIQAPGTGTENGAGDVSYYTSNTAEIAVVAKDTIKLSAKDAAGVTTLDLTNLKGVRRIVNISVAYIADGSGVATPTEKTLTQLAAMEEFSGSYKVTANITDLKATGAMTITDGTTTVEVGNAFSANGSTHYSLMEEKPVVGNEVTLIVTANKTDGGFEIPSARIQSYREVQVNEAMKISITKTEIEGLEITEDTVAVPVTGAQYADVAIVWTSSNEGVLSVNNETGGITVNKPTDEDATVTLTAKVGADNEGLTWQVTVEKQANVGDIKELNLAVDSTNFGDAQLRPLNRTVEGITFEGAKGNTTYATTYNTGGNTGAYIALYKSKDLSNGTGSTLTITCEEGYNILSIEFTTKKAVAQTVCQATNGTITTNEKVITLTATTGVSTVVLTNMTDDTQVDITNIKISCKKVA